MEKIFNKRLITIFCASIVALLVFTFVNENNIVISKNHQLTNDDETIITAVVTGLLPELGYEELMEKSSLVVRGKIIEQSKTFQITPTFSGSPSNFKDYYLQVNEVLRGDSNPDDIVSIRIQGGFVNGLDVIAEEEPDLNVGDEVLAYLYQSNMGSAYNTEGDYYYIVGVNQGVFYLDENAKDSDDKVRFYSTEGSEVEWDIVVSELNEFNQRNPVNENLVYDEFLENLNRNLKNEFITQEEYEILLNGVNEYATIVK